MVKMLVLCVCASFCFCYVFNLGHYFTICDVSKECTSCRLGHVSGFVKLICCKCIQSEITNTSHFNPFRAAGQFMHAERSLF